jgi:hypothetical protein
MNPSSVLVPLSFNHGAQTTVAGVIYFTKVVTR